MRTTRLYMKRGDEKAFTPDASGERLSIQRNGVDEITVRIASKTPLDSDEGEVYVRSVCPTDAPHGNGKD